jgi:hypothetical protein
VSAEKTNNLPTQEEAKRLLAEAEQRLAESDPTWCVNCDCETTRIVVITNKAGKTRRTPMCEGCFQAWHWGFISAQAGEDYETEEYVPAKSTDEV